MWKSHRGEPFKNQAAAIALAMIVVGATSARADGIFPLGETTPIPRLSDEPAPYLSVGDIPARPSLLLELGPPFLDTGQLDEGFELPGGAVWQPRLWVFATYRTALQTFDNGVIPDRISEWVHRLNVFANLQLTGTEKILLQIRPLDKNRFGQFTRYVFEPDALDGFNSEFNPNIRTLFFEGDLGSVFPDLDPEGQTLLDFGFSVGRQPLTFQEGILINDTVDAVGLVRNNVRLPGVSNLRITGVWGWDSLDRNDFRDGSDPYMFGLFNSADLPASTVNLDMIYVEDDESNGDAFYIGGSTTQRMGLFNTTFRVNGSIAEDADTPQVADGALLSAEVSWTVESSDDIVYVNPFLAIDRFTQAGREPVVGGALAALGILFASPSLGNYLSELSSFPNDIVGVATGYQAFWDNHRRNLVLELAAHKDTGDQGFDAVAIGFQLQQALGRRVQLQFEGFVSFQEDRDMGSGGRTEFLIQF